MREIWLRFVSWVDTPLFFKRARWICLGFVGLILVIQKELPAANVILWTVNEGTEFIDHIRLYPFLMAFFSGGVFMANFAMEESAKRDMQRKLNRETDPV